MPLKAPAARVPTRERKGTADEVKAKRRRQFLTSGTLDPGRSFTSCSACGGAPGRSPCFSPVFPDTAVCAVLALGLSPSGHPFTPSVRESAAARRGPGGLPRGQKARLPLASSSAPSLMRAGPGHGGPGTRSVRYSGSSLGTVRLAPAEPCPCPAWSRSRRPPQVSARGAWRDLEPCPRASCPLATAVPRRADRPPPPPSACFQVTAKGWQPPPPGPAVTFQGRNDTSPGPARGLSDPERVGQEGDASPASSAVLRGRTALPWRSLWVNRF